MTADTDTRPAVAAATPLDEMREFLGRFIYATPAQLDAICLWIGHTHVLQNTVGGHPVFDTTPRLLLTSTEPGCGKSETLRRIRGLAANGWSASRATKYSITAKLDCAADKMPTIAIDEVSTVYGQSGRNGAQHPLSGLLLNGYKHGETESFSVNRVSKDVSIFTAVAMAGRGNAVPDDVRERAVAVAMRKGKPEAQFVVRDDEATETVLRASVAATLRRNLRRLQEYSAKGRHPQLEGRLREVWEPLFAVAEVSGGTWPERCLSAFLDLAMNEADTQVLTPLQTYLRDVLAAARAIGADEIPGRDLVAALRATGTPLYDVSTRAIEMSLARAMEPYRPVQLTRTANDGRQPRGYYLADIEAVAAVRLPAPEPAEEPEIEPEDEFSIF